MLDMSPESASAIAEFNRRHGLDIEVLAFDSRRLPNITRGRWPTTVLTRLFLDQLIPPRIGRLLYIDADTLVVAPIDALRRIGFMGKPVAAVDDFIMAFPKKLRKRREAIGLGEESAYFNSGVMLFDWPESLRADILHKARENLQGFADNYHATDQDALNAALEGRWLRLSPRWNAQTGFLPAISKPVIVHFTGRRKPWRSEIAWAHRKYAGKYREYLSGTRWQDESRIPRLSEKAAGILLHLGKRIEGLRKAGKLRRYVNRADYREVWKDDDE